MFSHRCKFLLNIFTQSSTISSGSSSWICFFPNLYYLYFRTDERRSSWFLFLFILEMFFPLSCAESLVSWDLHRPVLVFIFKDVTLFIHWLSCIFLATRASLLQSPGMWACLGLLQLAFASLVALWLVGPCLPPGVAPAPPVSKGGLSATGPPGKSLSYLNYSFFARPFPEVAS